ncbi:MAG: hypothetical protein ABI895_24025 [Deltaproteobacteria bacterium]
MRRLLVTASFGFVASAVLACGGGFTEQNAPPRSGGAGGQGGGTGTGGGTAQAGSGGGGGMSGEPSEQADAGGPDAGGPGAGGGATTEFTYPSNCPVPNPVGIPGQKFAIQSYNFDASELVLKNISPTTQVIIGERLGWQWCSFPSYWNIAPEGNVTVLPGKTYKFTLINNTQGQWYLPSEGAELAIYVASGTFDEPEKMVSFVSWGTGLQTAGREYVATMAGLWTLNSRIEVDPSDGGFIATGTIKLGSGYEGVPKRCLVAPPNP